MNEAIEFGYWLVNSPKKEKFSREWINEKFKQFKKERELDDVKEMLDI